MITHPLPQKSPVISGSIVGIKEAAREACKATCLSIFCANDYSQMSSFICGSFSEIQATVKGREGRTLFAPLWGSIKPPKSPMIGGSYQEIQAYGGQGHPIFGIERKKESLLVIFRERRFLSLSGIDYKGMKTFRMAYHYMSFSANQPYTLRQTCAKKPAIVERVQVSVHKIATMCRASGFRVWCLSSNTY